MLFCFSTSPCTSEQGGRLAVIAATVLTVKLLLPLNVIMANGITDQGQLQEIVGKWIYYNKWRVTLWTIQWIGMMAYFLVAWSLQYRTKVSFTG